MKHDFEKLAASRTSSADDRDAKGRYPECPLGWCYSAEQCGTVRCCLNAKYKQEAENAATSV